jgi:hypothetical protein
LVGDSHTQAGVAGRHLLSFVVSSHFIAHNCLSRTCFTLICAAWVSVTGRSFLPRKPRSIFGLQCSVPEPQHRDFCHTPYLPHTGVTMPEDLLQRDASQKGNMSLEIEFWKRNLSFRVTEAKVTMTLARYLDLSACFPRSVIMSLPISNLIRNGYVISISLFMMRILLQPCARSKRCACMACATMHTTPPLCLQPPDCS